jgi:signal recognition particle subunit SRP54
MNESRIMRIARGSGHQVRQVLEMVEEYKRLAKIWKRFKMPKGNMSALSSRDMNVSVQHMGKALPPQILKQFGGIGGLQTIMKNTRWECLVLVNS